MSLLTVLIIIAAFVIACALIALLDNFLSPSLNYPRWVIQLAYGLLALVLVLYLCRVLGVWNLLSSVHT
jgi:hypothetical protein